LRSYLISNRLGLKDYRLELGCEGLRGLGAIEGNVDKLIACRMKKRGMSWSKTGANRMARLINLRESGELHQWISPGTGKRKLSPATKRRSRTRPPVLTMDDIACIEANMPALQGPQANRPWARALRTIAHGHFAFCSTTSQDSTD